MDSKPIVFIVVAVVIELLIGGFALATHSAVAGVGAGIGLLLLGGQVYRALD